MGLDGNLLDAWESMKGTTKLGPVFVVKGTKQAQRIHHDAVRFQLVHFTEEKKLFNFKLFLNRLIFFFFEKKFWNFFFSNLFKYFFRKLNNQKILISPEDKVKNNIGSGELLKRRQ